MESREASTLRSRVHPPPARLPPPSGRPPPRARHGRHLVRPPEVLPPELRLRDGRGEEGADLLPVRHAQRGRPRQLLEPPVPGAPRPGDARLLHPLRVLDLLRARRAVQGDGPPGEPGGGEAAQEALRRLPPRRLARRAQGLRAEAPRRAEDDQGLPAAGLRPLPLRRDARRVLRRGRAGRQLLAR